MNFTIDINGIIETGKKMTEMAEYSSVALENLQWKLGLPLYEQFILRDEEEKYMMNILGLNKDEFYKYSKIRGMYRQLGKFYDEEIERIRKEVSVGIHRDNIPFDITLTKDQAYQKYCNCDRETARKIADLMLNAERKATFHEKNIRESYMGDLSTQLGVDKARYLEEEKEYNAKMNVAREKIEGLMSKPETQERMAAFGEALGDYSDLAKKVSEEYGRTR